MGRDIDLFIHPERISSQLICPICTQVLENPVQTSTEHLFCEEELLEWLTRSTLCPITNTVLDPSSIRKPGRIVMNMLAELELRCPNTPHGCTWIGQNGQLNHHLKTCEHKSPADLHKEIARKDLEIQQLTEKVESLEQNNEELLEENMELKLQLIECEKKLRIYNAFLESSSNTSSPPNYRQSSKHDIEHKEDYEDGHGGINKNIKPTRHVGSDVDKLSRLRTLNTLPTGSENKNKVSSINDDKADTVHK